VERSRITQLVSWRSCGLGLISNLVLLTDPVR
jgi:hypothetical protein